MDFGLYNIDPTQVLIQRFGRPLELTRHIRRILNFKADNSIEKKKKSVAFLER